MAPLPNRRSSRYPPNCRPERSASIAVSAAGGVDSGGAVFGCGQVCELWATCGCTRPASSPIQLRRPVQVLVQEFERADPVDRVRTREKIDGRPTANPQTG